MGKSSVKRSSQWQEKFPRTPKSGLWIRCRHDEPMADSGYPASEGTQITCRNRRRVRRLRTARNNRGTPKLAFKTLVRKGTMAGHLISERPQEVGAVARLEYQRRQSLACVIVYVRIVLYCLVIVEAYCQCHLHGRARSEPGGSTQYPLARRLGEETSLYTALTRVNVTQSGAAYMASGSDWSSLSPFSLLPWSSHPRASRTQIGSRGHLLASPLLKRREIKLPAHLQVCVCFF